MCKALLLLLVLHGQPIIVQECYCKHSVKNTAFVIVVVCIDNLGGTCTISAAMYGRIGYQ